MLVVLVDQFTISNGSTTLDISYTVTTEVRFGQILAIIASLISQTDIFDSVKACVVLWKQNDEYWTRLTDNFESIRRIKRIRIIFFPYLTKFCCGTLVLLSSFVIVIKSDNIIDLFKDFAALQVISYIDNAAFILIENGYFGKQFAKKANK